jgi:hypothetical protein
MLKPTSLNKKISTRWNMLDYKKKSVFTSKTTKVKNQNHFAKII